MGGGGAAVTAEADMLSRVMVREKILEPGEADVGGKKSLCPFGRSDVNLAGDDGVRPDYAIRR
jgi:hypothetical protein